MPTMDRRTFSLGLVAMPLTGCTVPPPPGSPAASLASDDAQSLQPIVRNYGYWRDSFTYVATGGLKP